MPQRRQEPLPPSAERRRSVIEDGLSTPPKQLRRGASPAFMRWLLEELASRDEKVNHSISTHDLTMGAEWDKALQKKGYGYGEPTTDACIRALTKEAATSVYEFIAGASGLTWTNSGFSQPQGGVEFSNEALSAALQEKGTTNFTNAEWRDIVDGSMLIVHGKHFVKAGERYFLPEVSWKHKGAQPLRDKLATKFGDDWQAKVRAALGMRVASRRTLSRTPNPTASQCFGTATHFVSHAWECSFAGLIEAIEGIAIEGTPAPFVWCDIIAINQVTGRHTSLRPTDLLTRC